MYGLAVWIAVDNDAFRRIEARMLAQLASTLAPLRAEVDRMAKRRDAITAQLASLRDVVAGFGKDDE